MSMPALALALARAPIDPQETARQRIAAWMHGFSLEAVRVDAADIASLQAVPQGTPVYLTCVPGRPLIGMVEPARRLREAGFEPVPHLAVRNIASAPMLENLLSRLSAVARVRRMLVIGGDRDRPAGPFSGALDVIETGLLPRYGISEIGVAGYPQGHPRLSGQMLDRVLTDKIEAAEATGLKIHIVSQFCFDPAAVIDWIARLRKRGIDHPVRVGFAGPCNVSALIRFAQRCGVRASAQTVTRQAGLFKHLLGVSAPDSMIRPLADAMTEGQLGGVLPHLYSFGGVAATGRWAAAVKAGWIELDRADGFRVEPIEAR